MLVTAPQAIAPSAAATTTTKNAFTLSSNFDGSPSTGVAFCRLTSAAQSAHDPHDHHADGNDAHDAPEPRQAENRDGDADKRRRNRPDMASARWCEMRRRDDFLQVIPRHPCLESMQVGLRHEQGLAPGQFFAIHGDGGTARSRSAPPASAMRSRSSSAIVAAKGVGAECAA